MAGVDPFVKGSRSLQVGEGPVIDVRVNDPDEVVFSTDGRIENAGMTVTTGQLLLPDGTAAAPALTFSSDPDTGIFKSAIDRVGISAGGNLIAQFGTDINGLNISTKDISTDTTTGTKIGTTATQKLGFFGATPVVQQNVPLTSPTVQDVIDALVALGLVNQTD